MLFCIMMLHIMFYIMLFYIMLFLRNISHCILHKDTMLCFTYDVVQNVLHKNVSRNVVLHILFDV